MKQESRRFSYERFKGRKLMFRVAIGQDSHKFAEPDENKNLILGGIRIDGFPGLEGNSDADVVLHALTNAVSGISCVNLLGKRADQLCLVQGITDSSVYLKEALKTLGHTRIVHVSISIEALKPKLSPYIESMRQSIANLLNIDIKSVGITATTGEGLTEFGKGNGIFCTVILTTRE